MRRFELSDDRSHKFWEITLSGQSLQIRFGRVGSEGQRREKEFETAEEAQAAHERAVAEKLAGGYTLVHDDAPRATSASAGPDARNPELEAAILADPEDPQPYLVYGDWLQAQRDPRGELVSIQHALRQEKQPSRFLELRRAEQALLKRDEAYLLGPLVPELPHLKLEWRLGFIYSARISLEPPAEGEEQPSPARLLELLLGLPSVRFLQELGVRLASATAEGYQAIWDHLRSLELPPIRGLSLGDVAGGKPPRGELGQVGPLVAALPALRRLRLAGRAELEVTRLPELRLLELDTPDLELLRRALLVEMPALERLAVCTPGVGPEELTMIAGDRFPGMRHLAIRNARHGDDLCAVIAGSPLLGRLESLELSSSRLTERGASALARAGRKLRELQLDVSSNSLSVEGLAQLEGLCKAVKVGYQSRPRAEADEEGEEGAGAPEAAAGADGEREEGDGEERYDEIEE